MRIMGDELFNDLLARALREELKLINKYLPYKRVSLCELLSMDTPHIVSRDGAISLIDRRELELLKELLGSQACNLYIPIVIEYSSSLGEATYIVRDEYGAKALAKLLDIEYRLPLILYRPQLYEIRLKLRTTTTIVFIPE